MKSLIGILPAVRGSTGGALGQSTVAEYFPDSGWTVVILANYDRVT